MKRIVFTIAIMAGAIGLFAQNVGVGTASPDASSKLDVVASDKGLLIPRVALTALNAVGPITSPATSLLVYNDATAGTAPNDVTPGYYYWDGAQWVRLVDIDGRDHDWYEQGGTTAPDNIADNIFTNGNVGIGAPTPTHRFTIAGSGNIFGIDNASSFQARNSGGTFETYFWPRWSDNIMYMNYGSGGMNLRNNVSQTAIFIDNDRSIDIRKGVLFNCDDCGDAATIDGAGNYGDLIIQGRVLSTSSNLHLSPPSGFNVIIDDTYRAAGGVGGGSPGLIVEGNVEATSYLVNHGGGNVLEVGDDAWIRDDNTANTVYIRGVQDPDKGDLRFGDDNQYGISTEANMNGLGSIAANSNDVDGITLWQSSSEGAGINLNGDEVNIWSPGDFGIVRFFDEDCDCERATIEDNGAYTQVSDSTLKQDIEPIENALNKISSIGGYTYAYKQTKEEIEEQKPLQYSAGVIAQELNEVYPIAISPKENGLLFVNYDAMIPLLIEAIKEQQKQIEELKLLIEN